MPTIVGGWKTTKKRGRDDETIERDRNEAIARRKELRRRKTPSSQSSLAVRSQQVDDDSSSWIKTPCGNPRRRKHHSREPISPQRELFPKKSKPSDDEIQIVRKIKNKRYHHELNHHLLCERCGDKIINPIGGKPPKRLPKSPHSTIQSSRDNCGARARKRSRIIVTPDQKHEQIHSHSEHQPKIYRKNNKRRRHGAKVLSFGDEEDDTSLVTTRFAASNFQKRGRHCSTTTRNNRPSKSKQRKLRREHWTTKQLKPEPDFDRSAKYFYETLRRKKEAVKQNGSESMKDLLNNNRDFNLLAASVSSTAVVSQKSPLEHSKELEPNYPGADSMARTSKSRTEIQFELVQNLLLGKKSDQQQPLSTQQEDVYPMLHFKPSEQTSDSPKIIETGKKRPMNEHQYSLNQSARAENHTNTDISSRSKNNAKHQPAQHFTQQYTNDENASPSQTPSTSSSALLSLPMNYHLFGSSQPSFDGSRNCNRKGKEQRNETLGKADGGSTENTRRENEDPLRDVGFWQRIIEREETNDKNSNAPRSFKHTIASLVVAKNSHRDCSSSKHDNDGFLWLPSILEGGLSNTGLFEE